MSGNTITVSLMDVRKEVAKRGVFLVELPLDAINDDVGGALILLQREGLTLSQAILAILNDAGINAMRLKLLGELKMAGAGEVGS